MPGEPFKTLPNDLVEHGEALAAELEGRGYRVQREPEELEFPLTPALTGQREHTRVIGVVDHKVNRKDLDLWVAFCKSQTADHRLLLCVPSTDALTTDDEQYLTERLVGLCRCESSTIKFIRQPTDLALNLVLPPLRDQPTIVRQLLGTAYDQIEQGDWRGGFRSASETLEIECREYLKQGIKSGRIRVIDGKGHEKMLTVKKIDRMTLGQLERAFKGIAAPNYVDSRVWQLLRKINTDRVGVTHYKKRKITEARLRKNVGKEMWGVIAAIKLIRGET